jgi:hypothetical protein
MALNDLPAALIPVIQAGFLERRFTQGLRAKLGFRRIADREMFMAGIGETITKTRMGLLPANTTPMLPAAVTDITSGLTNANYAVEQYILGVTQYAVPMQLNVATARVAIDDLFLQNAYALAEAAGRSVDTLAQQALYAAYMGGNTRVTTTLGSPGTTVHVDDVRGFFQTNTTAGLPVAVSSSNPVNVLVGSTIYSMTACLADGTAPASINPWFANLTFSGSSSNSSTTPGGYSGTLTFATNVSVSDGTALNAVVSAMAPSIFRPLNATTGVQAGTSAAISATNDLNGGKLTIQNILTAKATLSANAVPPLESTGNYAFYADPIQMTGLFQDPAFQYFFRGKPESREFRRGLVAELLECDIIETNLNPVQTLAGVGVIRRGVLCGQGALVEGVFTREAMAAAVQVDDSEGMITVVDDIAHIVREPIDALKQVVTQSTSYIGGFVSPTDITTTSAQVPTATSAAYKRAAIIESL